MLVELVDGGILDITSDNYHYDGCETCDFGSEYVNEYDIKMTKGRLKINTNQMYEYALSEGYMMTTMLQNVEYIKKLTESEFVDWLKRTLKKELSSELEFVYIEY